VLDRFGNDFGLSEYRFASALPVHVYKICLALLRHIEKEMSDMFDVFTTMSLGM